MPVIPAKIKPGDWSEDDRLYTLNQFHAHLTTLLSDPAKQKTVADAIKVVDCLRFIKVNEAFISYAFKNRDDLAIYTLWDDKIKGVLRDFNNTSFHIDIYNDATKTQDECLKACLEDLHNNIDQFEDAIRMMTKKNKLSEFIDKLTYDENTGCLTQRTLQAQIYAKEIETLFDSKMLADGLYFETLMNEIAAKFTDDDTDKNYQMVYEFFEPYIGKWSRHGKSDEIEITYEFIIKYMGDVLRQDPPQVLPGQKYYDEFLNNQAAQRAIKLAYQERSLVKVVGTAVSDQTSLSFMLNQLKDPVKVRPVPQYNATFVDRTKSWDPKDGKFKQRSINTKGRGLPKLPDWKFTKKTSTTLLPTNSKINLFTTGITSIGLQFDIDLCNLKNEKYIWSSNAVTNDRWWLSESGSKLRSISLETLRQTLREGVESGTVPYHNEILACLAKEALTSVFATVDTAAARLNALFVKDIIKSKFNIDLPVLIITPTNGARVYSKKEMLADIRQEISSANWNTQRILTGVKTDPIELIVKLQQEMIIEEKAEAYRLTVRNVFEHYIKTNQSTAALEMLNRKSEAFVIEHDIQLLNQTLVWAMKNNEKALALKLLALGANPDDQALKLAIDGNDHEILDDMLTRSLSKKALGQAMVKAIETNKTEVALKILKHKFNISNFTKENTNESLLILAIKNNNEEIVQALIDKDANPVIADRNNLSALSYMVISTMPNRFNLTVAMLKNPSLYPEFVVSFLKIMMDNSVVDVQWKEDDIVNFIAAIPDKISGSYRSALLNYAEHKKLHKVVQKLIIPGYSNRYTESLISFIENTNRNFTDEQSEELLEGLKSFFDNVSQQKKYQALEFAVKSNRPLVAKKLFAMGAIPDGRLLKNILNRNQNELAIHLIASGELSGKTLTAADAALVKEQRAPEMQLKLNDALATLYEANITRLSQELKQFVTTNQNQRRTFSIFRQNNSPLKLNAVKKLISQIETQEYQEFSSEEVSALQASNITSILNRYKDVDIFPVALLKSKTRLELDTEIKSRRGAGSTPVAKLANTILAIEVDLRHQYDLLTHQLLHASNSAVRVNLNNQLSSIKLTQEAIHSYKHDAIDLPELIDTMSRARDHARTIKPPTIWSYIVTGISRLFGKHNSLTTKTIDNAVAEITKLKQTTPEIASITRSNASSSVSLAEPYQPPADLNKVKEQLTALLAKDNNYTAVVDKIHAEILQFETSLDKSDSVNNFRKSIRALSTSVNNLAASPAHQQFKDVIYDALIAAAVLKPVNNENQDPITMNDLVDIEPESLIYLSDGYFYEIPTLVHWIKERGVMENPSTRMPLLEHDKLAVIKAGEKLHINLKNLNPSDYKVEEDPAMLDAAIALALESDASRPVQGGLALQNFGHFQPATAFMQRIAQATGKTVQYWEQYQTEHPYRFTRVANAAPYIEQGFLTIDQAIALTPDQAEGLALLTAMDFGFSPEDLAAQVNEIINSSNISNRRS